MKGKKSKITAQATVVFVILIVAVVGYYCYLVNHYDDAAAETTLTAVENVLVRDLENNYPPTPKEVIRYYNEIIKCFYNEACSGEEIEALARKTRELYDQELLDYNPWDTHILKLQAEIQDFRDNSRKISSISLASSTDVDEFTEDGYQFARIRCGYNILQGKESTYTSEVYLLRRDADGHWKIYGWELADQPEGES